MLLQSSHDDDDKSLIRGPILTSTPMLKVSIKLLKYLGGGIWEIPWLLVNSWLSILLQCSFFDEGLLKEDSILTYISIVKVSTMSTEYIIIFFKHFE